MENTNWRKQAKDQPSFPDTLWSRPENRRHAGKLLIIGGNKHSFAAVSSAYSAANGAGIGTARVMLPDSLERMLIKVFPEAEFTSSTLSGSFARTALGPMCDAAAWGDHILLAGDFGKNSETAILLESFLAKYKDGVVLAGNGIDYFYNEPSLILDRPSTTLVAEFNQLQKLLSGRLLLKHSMNLAQLAEALARLASNCQVNVVTAHSDQIIVAASGQVSTTPASRVDFAELAAHISVWSLQQPGKTFEALTTAVYCYLQS
ncbi:MAG TPA: hypothetical protein VFT49_01835 [Candidatus Saccharimonadales bacterium]|nr:hypothetical protein [Candidatus Saccharimonadales bacterium]